MKFGAQLYTLREYLKTEDDIRSTMKKVADMGYKYVQASGFQYDPSFFRSVCDENGLEIIVTHYNAERIVNETQKVIDEHKILGCNYIGIGGFSGEKTLEGARDFLKTYTPAMQLIHDNGMKFQYHNHAFEFERFDGVSMFDVLIEESDPELMGFTLDTYWIQYGGKCPVEMIKKLKGRINVCHLKDYAIVENTPRYAAVGNGNLNWDKIIAAFEEAGAEYAFVEQDDCYGKSPFDELKASCDYLKKY